MILSLMKERMTRAERRKPPYSVAGLIRTLRVLPLDLGQVTIPTEANIPAQAIVFLLPKVIPMFSAPSI